MSTDPPAEFDPAKWDMMFSGDEVDVGPRVVEVRRLASATRRMIEELMSTSASIDAIAEAAALVEGAVALLAGHPHDRPEDHVSESAVAGDPGSFLEFSPLIGKSNPIAPPLELALVDGRIVGTAIFGSAYEGPPGHVHGGHIAAAFDEVLGMVQSTTKKPGMTGMLTVRYRSPTPLQEVLTFTGEVVRVEGRKIFTRATLHHGDVLCAESEGLFISIDFSRFADLAQGKGATRPSGG
jgi:acyl-coenzyme A thioesterase PaaI-like protein